jgi:stage II sporulation protein D
MILSFRFYNLILILLLTAGFSYGRSDSIYLKVRVLSNQHINHLSIIPLQGQYNILYNNTTSSDLSFKLPCVATINGNKVKFSKSSVSLGSYDTIKIVCKGNNGIVKIKTGTIEKTYDDDIILYISDHSIQVVNQVELEDYVASVILSEGGDAKYLEFYKVQGLISRTYALRNIRKHEKEGYHLCDQVHCQLYHGHTIKPEILEAVNSTRGLVILGPDTQLISAAFHSNSGGETTNSENVWSLPAPYLTSVDDSFSLSMPMAFWEKKIQKKQWVNNLKTKYHFPVTNRALLDSALSFKQEHRKVYYISGIPLKELRNDFQLKSTFFSLEDHGEYILIKGRGYGHGVGLSQEGALSMVKYGCNFEEVLKHYYKDVIICTVDTSMIPRKK